MPDMGAREVAGCASIALRVAAARLDNAFRSAI